MMIQSADEGSGIATRDGSRILELLPVQPLASTIRHVVSEVSGALRVTGDAVNDLAGYRLLAASWAGCRFEDDVLRRSDHGSHRDPFMPAFAIAHLHQITVVREVLDYMRRIDQTLVPFEGVFRVHGAPPRVLEGAWPGHVIVIEFPDMRRARGWYDSDAYQAILPLRTAHSVGAAILVDGVEQGYRAAATADGLAALGDAAKG
jgi:uncharacterized protein (DUF1330 family)